MPRWRKVTWVIVIWSVTLLGGGLLWSMYAAGSNCADVVPITESCQRDANQVMGMVYGFFVFVWLFGLLLVLLPISLYTRRRHR